MAILDRRATLIVWAFLIGVIVSEGWATLAVFGGKKGLLVSLSHYTFTPPGNAPAWGLAALATLLYVAYAAARSATIRTHLLRPSTWRPYIVIRIVAVAAALISGFFEEAFFRKFLMDWAMRHGHDIAAQIVLSALIFGAAHAIWGIAGGNLRAALGAMLATSVLGAALAVVYVVGGRSVAPCVAAHIAINLLIEPWLIITSATNGWRGAIKPPTSP
jgi:hypothetical protein